MKKIAIAIDGHSSTGKSTVAKALAKAFQYTYIDTGAMYRAIAYFVLSENLITNSTEINIPKLLTKLDYITIEIIDNTLYLNGKPLDGELRSLDVSNIVSYVAEIPEIRKKLVSIQQDLGKDKGIVMDGRDIGTVVFPNAELKVFMTATAETRAQRRFNELIKNGASVSFNEVLENVQLRDRIDSTREDSPLIQAEDAILIDNSTLSQEDQFHILEQLAKDRIAGRV